MRILLSLMIVLSGRLALAHPHDFILYQAKPVLNADGKISALAQKWEFSPFTAHSILEPVLKADTPEAQDKAFQDTRDKMYQALASANFNTFAADIFTTEPEFALEVNDDGVLELFLTMYLQTPSHTLRYQIYEPSYYVLMTHDDNQLMRWDNGCQLNIKQPNPSEEDFITAAMLDINARGPANLGAIFAETGVIKCP